MNKAISFESITTPNGKLNWFGIMVFIATLLVAAYTVYQLFLLPKERKLEQKKIDELEANLREIRGNSYTTIS